MSRNQNTTRLVDSLLLFASMGGVLAVTLIAPGAGGLVAKTLLRDYPKSDRNREYKRLLRLMKRQNLITIENQKEGGQLVALTEDGKKRAFKVELESLQIQPPNKWDGRWRLVIFDIPESKKAARNALSSKLRDLGFKQLQRSVWVHPFSCTKEISVLKDAYQIEPYVSVATVNEIDDHNHLVKRFSNLLLPYA